MRVEISKITELYNSYLALLYIVFAYFARILNNSILFYLLVIFGFVLLLHCIANKKTYVILLCTSFFVIATSLLSIKRGYVPDNYLILFPSLFFAIFIWQKKINSKVILYSLYLVSLLILYRLISNPFIILGLEHFTEWNSVNFISVILMAILSVYYLICYKNGESFSIYPTVIVFFISALSTSRSAIACMLLVLLSFAYVYIKDNRIDIKNIIKVVIPILLLVFILIYMSFEYFDIRNILDKVLNEGFSYSENIRTEMLLDYISQMDISCFLLGFDFWANNFYEGYIHPHNTYVIMHRNYGILSFVLFAFLISCLLKLRKKHLLLFFVYLSLLLRASSDYVFFGNFEDYSIISFIIFPFFKTDK